MGISIQISGEAVYTVGDDSVRITADLLKQDSVALISTASFKEDDEDWVAQFSVVTGAGRFIWDVYFSVGLSGGSFDYAELKSPSLVGDVTDRMVFTAVDVDDDGDGDWP